MTVYKSTEKPLTVIQCSTIILSSASASSFLERWPIYPLEDLCCHLAGTGAGWSMCQVTGQHRERCCDCKKANGLPKKRLEDKMFLAVKEFAEINCLALRTGIINHHVHFLFPGGVPISLKQGKNVGALQLKHKIYHERLQWLRKRGGGLSPP